MTTERRASARRSQNGMRSKHNTLLHTSTMVEIDVESLTEAYLPILIKLMGLLIIVGSCLNKAPLFRNIVKTKSVAGMSSSAVYSESIMYANAALYSLRRGNPFTAYGETLLITLQSIIVVILMWRYQSEPAPIPIRERLLATFLFAAYLTLVFAMPLDQLYLLMSINMPVTIFSRGSQIYHYYTCKHTGSQSIITVIMNFTGSAIRVVTTINEIGFDIPMLAGYGISLMLNSIMITQFILFKSNTEKHMKQLKDKKKD